MNNNNNNKQNNGIPKSSMVPIAVILIVMVMMSFLFGNTLFNGNGKEVEYTEFLDKIKSDDVKAIKYNQQDQKIYGLNKNSTRSKDDLPRSYDFFAVVTDPAQLRADMTTITAQLKEINPNMVSALDYNFDLDYQKPSSFSLFSIIPYLFLIGGLFFLFNIMRQQTGGASAFGKSKARVVTSEKNKITFADVAGADEEKEELSEIVDFLKNPKKFDAMGARIPKGVLLTGPPGTGKTLLAKAVAGEANVKFYSISGSDFVELYAGVGASRVRDLFATAKKTAPAIIFIDEIDAVGRQRSASANSGAHDEREQTLNQLLVEMDGFNSNIGVVVIAATNRSDILDSALLRSGRFDRNILVNRPDLRGREAILKVHAKGKPFSDDINMKILAQRTPGFTGADLENMLNEAAILAVRENKKVIEMSDVEEAITREVAGLAKRSHLYSEDDKKLTAYHEVGHAVVSRELMKDKGFTVREISIIPRGKAGGYTITMPNDDMNYITKEQLLNQIAMAMGGRVAEEIYLSDISAGASDDLRRATEIARQMVTQLGMSDRVGPLFLDSNNGQDMTLIRPYGEEVATIIDEEVKIILEEAYQRAKLILIEKRDMVERLVKVLVAQERIMGEDFEKICLDEMVILNNIEYEKREEAYEAKEEGKKEPDERKKENLDSFEKEIEDAIELPEGSDKE